MKVGEVPAIYLVQSESQKLTSHLYGAYQHEWSFYCVYKNAPSIQTSPGFAVFSAFVGSKESLANPSQTTNSIILLLHRRSAFRHAALGLVVVHWSEANPSQMSGIPKILKEQVLQLLLIDDHYEETT